MKAVDKVFVDEFLRILSHELRTPLQAILSWTQVLRTGTVDAATSAHALEVIERSTRTQAQLIEGLLDVSRIISGRISLHPSPIELSAMIESRVDAVRSTAAGKKIHIQVVLAAPCQVMGDASRLRQVTDILLSNALKYTPNSGHILVQLDQPKGQARVRVTRSGKGIAADLLPYVFEPFPPTQQTYARLDFDLAVLRHLVELHGGAVHAESPREGLGTTLVVMLPLLSDDDRKHQPWTAPTANAATGSCNRVNEASQAEATTSVPARSFLKGLRVLVVDDEQDCRECLAVALEHWGARVIAAPSAAAAIAALDHGAVDVMVCDLGMPGEDGYSLIRKIRARTPEHGGQIPAAALTAYARAEDRLRALNAGFHAHITKPVEPAALATIVKQLTTKPSTSARQSGRSVEYSR